MIQGIDTKCFILALFVRDDGERFLLGDGDYEFTDEQLHFAANTMANDVVEVQGNDGYLLAGQVRRPGVQSFDGYVGGGTTAMTNVETARKAFFEFFRKNFFYKVIYIFPDGSAIQRKRGFLVDAPTVEELYQIYPKYHVALNFEDINYYSYYENSSGEEIYGKSAEIKLTTTTGTGGLIWSGGNLFNINTPPNWIGANTNYTVNGNTLSVSGQWYVAIPVMVAPNTDYYISATRSNMSGSSGNLGDIAVYATINGTQIAKFDNNGTFNSGNRSKIWLVFYCGGGAGSSGSVDFSNIKLEEGTSATSYSDYGGAKGVLWDNLGAIWEESSGGGPTTVLVDSIESIYPVWTITGPATNPELTNITTGATLSYTGTVTAGSKLVIDMFNKTAKLNGTSVIGNVSGDWIHFAPGNNRVTYTTDNTNAVSSLIEWQEIVG